MTPEQADQLKKLIKRYERVRARDFSDWVPAASLKGICARLRELLRSSMDSFSAEAPPAAGQMDGIGPDWPSQ